MHYRMSLMYLECVCFRQFNPIRVGVRITMYCTLGKPARAFNRRLSSRSSRSSLVRITRLRAARQTPRTPLSPSPDLVSTASIDAVITVRLPSLVRAAQKGPDDRPSKRHRCKGLVDISPVSHCFTPTPYQVVFSLPAVVYLFNKMFHPRVHDAAYIPSICFCVPRPAP